MKLIKDKKGMSLIYVISMMFVVMALTLMMLSAAMYNNTLANLTKSKFETKISLDQIGEDFVRGETIQVIKDKNDSTFEISEIEIVGEIGIEVKKNNKVLLTVEIDDEISRNIIMWKYGEK